MKIPCRLYLFHVYFHSDIIFPRICVISIFIFIWYFSWYHNIQDLIFYPRIPLQFSLSFVVSFTNDKAVYKQQHLLAFTYIGQNVSRRVLYVYRKAFTYRTVLSSAQANPICMRRVGPEVLSTFLLSFYIILCTLCIYIDIHVYIFFIYIHTYMYM